MMVFAQSWTAHHRLPLHRAVGLSSLLLFPFLIGGLAAIIDVTAKGYITADHPVRVMFGGPFLIGLALAVAAYVPVYYRALKCRRKVRSEERRVGKECVRTGRSRGAPYH